MRRLDSWALLKSTISKIAVLKSIVPWRASLKRLKSIVSLIKFHYTFDLTFISNFVKEYTFQFPFFFTQSSKTSLSDGQTWPYRIHSACLVRSAYRETQNLHWYQNFLHLKQLKSLISIAFAARFCIEINFFNHTLSLKSTALIVPFH